MTLYQLTPGAVLRNELTELLRACSKCEVEFTSNIALLVTEDDTITDEQVVAVLNHLRRLHVGH